MFASAAVALQPFNSLLSKLRWDVQKMEGTTEKEQYKCVVVHTWTQNN